VLANPTNAGAPALLANVKEAARRFNMSVVVAEVTRAEDLDKALSVLRDARPDALLVAIEPMIFVNRARVLDFAAASRLPASFDVGGSIVRQQGGLMSYGPVLTNHYGLVAEYVDKILKGAKPGDLPIQQPTQFALVINLKTAKALGLEIPQSLLLRADEVIQ
jgi:putative ABC transport system substrate-binding protein